MTPNSTINIPEHAELYIGLMSGTSADGIDLALIDCQQGNIALLAHSFQPYTAAQQLEITSLYLPCQNELDASFHLDKYLGKLFAKTIHHFIKSIGLTPCDIVAIGNHGQTIRHRPLHENSFTLQIGCNQTLASLTNIRVIGDFRQKDMVFGGQGAPLVPAFHQQLFNQQKKTDDDIFVVNIGGIANLTYLPNQTATPIVGFDTGPGNALMDAWYHNHHQGQYDKNGDWANSGKVSGNLLSELLSDNYFSLSAPKSTGREYFHLPWLEQYIAKTSFSALSANDIQATLLHLTASSIANEIKQISNKADIYLCGGGILNNALLTELKQQLAQYHVATIGDLNIENDAFEAMAFAWLAYAFDKKINGNVPSVTGASKALVLGVEYNQ